MSSFSVAIIGGGPAGLMAAEVLAGAGARVDVYDAMPSVGRKFLLAGRGGLNLTHSEPFADFLARYGASAAPPLQTWLQDFDADALRAWVHGLGIETFVGSSGRVFPREMKAAPLLRAWLHRLRASGVVFHARHRWTGWHEDGALRLETPQGTVACRADATLLALGGASWPRLGSDGAWWPLLAQRGVALAPLAPANCGFDVGWGEHFAGRHAGQPLKSIAMAPVGHAMRMGECMVTATGLEGGLVYAWSAPLREAIAAEGSALLHIDLLPGRTADFVEREVTRSRGARSLSSHLRGRVGLHGAKFGLLRECTPPALLDDPVGLARAIKRLPVRLRAPRPIEEAISCAGGVRWEAIDTNAMLHAVPGVFCAGEMIDWEAPTGGYLLTACLAQGVAAAQGIQAWLARQP